jgi:hypothetical protein
VKGNACADSLYGQDGNDMLDSLNGSSGTDTKITYPPQEPRRGGPAGGRSHLPIRAAGAPG